MPIRVARDCHEALRSDAFQKRTQISKLLDDVIRKAYRLPKPEARA